MCVHLRPCMKSSPDRLPVSPLPGTRALTPQWTTPSRPTRGSTLPTTAAPRSRRSRSVTWAAPALPSRATTARSSQAPSSSGPRSHFRGMSRPSSYSLTCVVYCLLLLLLLLSHLLLVLSTLILVLLQLLLSLLLLLFSTTVTVHFRYATLVSLCLDYLFFIIYVYSFFHCVCLLRVFFMIQFLS